MYRYRNRNTDDVVEREERSPRLDHLPNWDLIEQPPAPAPAKPTPAKRTKATPTT